MENQNIQQLQERVDKLEQIVNYFVYPDRYQFERTVQHKGNKLGFYKLDPIAQPSSTGETTGASAASVTNTTTFTGNNGSTAYTILDVVKHLKNLGLLLK